MSISKAEGEVGYTLNWFKPPPSNFKLQTVPMRMSDVVLYVLCVEFSFCTVSPSVCLNDIYLGLGS